jgi:hypothetical protein
MTKTERTIAEIKDDIARVEQELAEAKQELATASAIHVITIVWGDRLDPTDVDPSEEIYTYSFETDAETKAFLAGVHGAIGWDGFAVMESTEEDFPVGGYSA